MIRRTFQVSYELQVQFTKNVFEPTNLVLKTVLDQGGNGRPHKTIVILDEALASTQPDISRRIETYFETHSEQLQLVCPPIIIEGGERTKNSYFHVSEIHSHLDRYHIDRHSYVIGVGGGALLDVAGLAAATAHRGVRHVRIPTTTLSQADSGVGVKNGINAFGKKNFIGTFAPPFAGSFRSTSKSPRSRLLNCNLNKRRSRKLTPQAAATLSMSLAKPCATNPFASWPQETPDKSFRI